MPRCGQPRHRLGPALHHQDLAHANRRAARGEQHADLRLEVRIMPRPAACAEAEDKLGEVAPLERAH